MAFCSMQLSFGIARYPHFISDLSLAKYALAHSEGEVCVCILTTCNELLASILRKARTRLEAKAKALVASIVEKNKKMMKIMMMKYLLFCLVVCTWLEQWRTHPAGLHKCIHRHAGER